ncbi:CD3324 family protein [Viridibacillus sp. NPDC096237]|uniref:CD3324 family protein n=1 Tax=Viridibacillus sp. NPDC096237 TaxID=3390721 RepID=UPI003D0224CC
MSYKRANNLLPTELVELIQKYVDGEYIYIPRKEENKKTWGTDTATRRELDLRNSNIYNDFLSGIDTTTLAGKYYLSSKSIQRIILKEKKVNNKSMWL